MHYVHKGHATVPTRFGSTPSIASRVRDEVVPRVPADTWCELELDPITLPLRYDTSTPSIVAAAFPHATGARKSNAVYVLECLANDAYGNTAASLAVNIGRRWSIVSGADRILYVGVTVNLIRRLYEHLNSPGDSGANFTAVFPPIRVLDVSWWSTYARAERAERLVAAGLRERFPNDYVSQPG